MFVFIGGRRLSKSNCESAEDAPTTTTHAVQVLPLDVALTCVSSNVSALSSPSIVSICGLACRHFLVRYYRRLIDSIEQWLPLGNQFSPSSLYNSCIYMRSPTIASSDSLTLGLNSHSPTLPLSLSLVRASFVDLFHVDDCMPLAL